MLLWIIFSIPDNNHLKWLNKLVSIQEICLERTWFPPKQLIQIPGLSRAFSLFPELFASKSQEYSQIFNEIPGLSSTFMELYE